MNNSPTNYAAIFCIQPASLADDIRVLASSNIFQQILRPLASISRHLLFGRQACAPGCLPAPIKLYGREDCITQIIEQVERRVTPLAIIGPPGIGKTAIAQAIIHDDRIANRFGDHRHWIMCSGEEEGEPSLEKFIDAVSQSLRVSTSNGRTTNTSRVDSIIAILRQSDHPRLIVLDGFDALWSHTTPHAAANILRQIHTIPNITLLLTTRSGAAAPQDAIWQHAITIPPLPARAAKLLFLSIYPKSSLRRLDELLHKVDHVPFVVSLLAHAGRAGHMEPAELLAQLDQPQHTDVGARELHGRLREFAASAVQSASMRAHPDALALLRVLSLLPHGASHAQLRELAPGIGDIAGTASVVSSLSLALSHSSSGHMQLLYPIRSYFLKYEHLDAASRQNLYEYYFARARRGGSQPGDENFSSAVQLLTDEQGNIEAVLEDALEKGCVVAVEAAIEYSRPLCAIRPRVDIMEKAITLAQNASSSSSSSSDSLLLLCRCLQRLGEMHSATGYFNPAREAFLGAIRLYRQLEQPQGEAECLLALGNGRYRCNYRDEGMSQLRTALSLFRRLEHRPGEAKCLLSIAEKDVADGDGAEGLQKLGAARAIFRETGDWIGVAECEVVAAQLHVREGRVEDARAAFQGALRMFQKAGHRAGAAECQRQLAYFHCGRHDADARAAALRASLREFETLGNRLDAAFCMWRLGRYVDDEEAVKLYERAIPEFWDANFIFAGAECRLALGFRYMRMKRYSDALAALQIAHKELLRNGTRELAAECLYAVLVCHLVEKRGDAVRAILEQNRDEFVRLGVLRIEKVEEIEEMVKTGGGCVSLEIEN